MGGGHSDADDERAGGLSVEQEEERPPLEGEERPPLEGEERPPLEEEPFAATLSLRGLRLCMAPRQVSSVEPLLELPARQEPIPP